MIITVLLRVWPWLQEKPSFCETTVLSSHIDFVHTHALAVRGFLTPLSVHTTPAPASLNARFPTVDLAFTTTIA